MMKTFVRSCKRSSPSPVMLAPPAPTFSPLPQPKEETKISSDPAEPLGPVHKQKLMCAQLAPIMDRLGRAFVDASQRFAAIAYEDYATQSIATEETLRLPRFPGPDSVSLASSSARVECQVGLMPTPAEIASLTDASARTSEIHIHEIIISRDNRESQPSLNPNPLLGANILSPEDNVDIDLPNTGAILGGEAQRNGVVSGEARGLLPIGAADISEQELEHEYGQDPEWEDISAEAQLPLLENVRENVVPQTREQPALDCNESLANNPSLRDQQRHETEEVQGEDIKKLFEEKENLQSK